MSDLRNQKTPPDDCPRCGHKFASDELLRSLKPVSTRTLSASGGQEHSNEGDFNFHCGGCRTTLSLPQQQAATLLIEKQMRDLFASITATLQGDSTLQ